MTRSKFKISKEQVFEYHLGGKIWTASYQEIKKPKRFEHSIYPVCISPLPGNS